MKCAQFHDDVQDNANADKYNLKLYHTVNILKGRVSVRPELWSGCPFLLGFAGSGIWVAL